MEFFWLFVVRRSQRYRDCNPVAQHSWPMWSEGKLKVSFSCLHGFGSCSAC